MVTLDLPAVKSRRGRLQFREGIMNGNSVLNTSITNRIPWAAASGCIAIAGTLTLVGLLALASPAFAATATVGLGTASNYSVLAGETVTNTGPSTLAGNVGVSPGSAITGFPPGNFDGARHAADAAAGQAKSDLRIAYDDAAGRAPDGNVAGDLVGLTKTPGVYKSTGPLHLSGTLTLDAQGDPHAVFVFQVASDLITASASSVSMINGATACNVFWQVGSSATLGTNSVFRGTIMALTSISVTTGTVVHGRALARNGQVSLDNNVFTNDGCVVATPTGSSSSATASSSSTTSPASGTTSGTATGTAIATGTAGLSNTTPAGVPSSSPFVPGVGLTGDSSQDRVSPLTKILFVLALAVLGSAAIIVVPFCRRGTHS